MNIRAKSASVDSLLADSTVPFEENACNKASQVISFNKIGRDADLKLDTVESKPEKDVTLTAVSFDKAQNIEQKIDSTKGNITKNLPSIGKSLQLVDGIDNRNHDDKEVDSKSSLEFSFERMVIAFEAVEFSPGAGLPLTIGFLDAMEELILLFDHLGTAFYFARTSISTKTILFRQYVSKQPALFLDLDEAVKTEIRDGTTALQQPPSVARTLLRLLWALEFISMLLNYIMQSLKPDSPIPPERRTMKSAVSTSYEAALAFNHPWTLRSAVRASLVFLPSRDEFIDKIGANSEYLERFESSITPTVNNMKTFYEKENLLKLP